MPDISHAGNMADAEAVVDEITAIGNRVRGLKASKAAEAVVGEEVAKLLAAKQRYKDVTGNDYAPATKQKKSKVATESEEVAQAAPGTSKNAAKKAEKAAKKAASKAAKAQNPAGSTPRTAMAQDAPQSAPAPLGSATTTTSSQKAPAMADSLPSMFLSGDDSGPLKCATAAAFYGIQVGVSAVNPAGDLSFAPGCALTVRDSLIFGSTAMCRYFWYASASRSKDLGDADSAMVDWWLDWERTKLAPLERSLALTPPAGRAAPTEVLAALSHIEGKLTGKWLMRTKAPCLADVIVGTTTKAVITLLGDTVASHYPKVKAYLSNLEGVEAWAQAAGEAAKFTKAAAGVTVKAGLQASLSVIFDAAMFKAWPLAKEAGMTSSSVVKCPNYKHGDFQCNAAMCLYKRLKGTEEGPSTPTAAASAIVEAVPPSQLIQDISVAPGGFINIRLRPAFINSGIAKIIKSGPAPPKVKHARVVVDFSSPNIAKEMHVGHLRSTIIGDAICRVLEFCGHTVFRHNHVGDWGTQFGMLINYMREAYPNFLTDPPNITDLTTFYKAAKLRFDASEEFKEASRKTVVDLQSGDQTCREVWTLLCDISRKEFQKVYDRLGVVLDEHGESFYNAMIPSTIDALDAAGLITKDDGADIVRLDHFVYPLIVRKRDGGYGYDSTDMAAIRYRIKELKCDWIIYITDAGQEGHFHMCFDAARAAGWLPGDARLDHLGFGVVQGEDGKKFKTRSGETVRLVDLLDEAVRRMAATIQERMDAGKITTSEEAAAASAAEMGYGAVKYFDLRQHPATSYIFSYDRMLDTRGNTAVYLQFAHARLASILRKAEEELNVDLASLKASPERVTVEHDAERALAFELMVFSDVIEACLADLGPNRLCEYLYTLATKFTDFVTNCRVLGSDKQESRLLLCEATGVTMRKCFSLLGMNALYRI